MCFLGGTVCTHMSATLSKPQLQSFFKARVLGFDVLRFVVRFKFLYQR